MHAGLGQAFVAQIAISKTLECWHPRVWDLKTTTGERGAFQALLASCMYHQSAQ